MPGSDSMTDDSSVSGAFDTSQMQFQNVDSVAQTSVVGEYRYATGPGATPRCSKPTALTSALLV